jgi:hypothetical protein
MTVSEPCWAERNSDSMRLSSRPASVAASSSFSRDATCSSSSALATYKENNTFKTETHYINSLRNERDLTWTFVHKKFLQHDNWNRESDLRSVPVSIWVQ